MKRRLTALALSLLAAAASAEESPLLACRKIAAAAERLACYDAIAPASLSTKAGPDTSGGEQPKLIETGIAGRFSGWWPNEKITMTNGQVWQIIDGSTGAENLTNPKVTIRREFMGGYHPQAEPSPSS